LGRTTDRKSGQTGPSSGRLHQKGDKKKTKKKRSIERASVGRKIKNKVKS